VWPNLLAQTTGLRRGAAPPESAPERAGRIQRNQ
jgi:hypothetical protein